MHGLKGTILQIRNYGSKAMGVMFESVYGHLKLYLLSSKGILQICAKLDEDAGNSSRTAPALTSQKTTLFKAI